MIELITSKLDWLTLSCLEDIDESNLIYYKDDNQIHGFTGFTINDKTVTIILYVFDEHRKLGIGTQLYHDLMNKLRTINYDTIEVMFLKNDATFNFFKQYNFSEHYRNIKMVYNRHTINIDTSKVEQYEDKHFNEVAEFSAKAFYPVHKANNLNPYYSVWDTEVRKWLNDNIDCCYIIKEADKVIGFSFVKNDEIDKIIVNPDYQGKGYGKILASHAVNTIIDNGYQSAFLYMLSNNPSAYKLYQTVGFEAVGELVVMKKTSN